MIKILDKRRCTGCGACANACSLGAITIDYDEEGFLYPTVNGDVCVDCHKCEKACPFLNKSIIDRKKVSDPAIFSGQMRSSNDLVSVSSGGISWAIIEYVLDNNGVVYGAVQTDVFDVHHERFEKIESAKLIKKSKYLQSNTRMCFRDVKNDLKNNRLVLFTGVGCQIAGLKSFLGNDYNNLILVDVVCHGVPSYYVWKKYVEETEKKKNSKIISVSYRDKTKGWKYNQYRIDFIDGSCEYVFSDDHPFHKGFLLGLYSRPSCGDCKFGILPRVSDLTLADYWKYDGNLFENSINQGVSLISVNTEKGKEFLSHLDKYAMFEPSSLENALLSCRHLNHSPKESKKRKKFFKYFKTHAFYQSWSKFIKRGRPSFFVRAIKRVFGGNKCQDI